MAKSVRFVRMRFARSPHTLPDSQNPSADLNFDAPSAPDFQGVGDSDYLQAAPPDDNVDSSPEMAAYSQSTRPDRSRKMSSDRKTLSSVAVRAESVASTTSHESLTVCLTCGASPTVSSECAHEETARLDSLPPALAAIARKLQSLTQERAAQERALRRSIAMEVSAGRGEIVLPPHVVLATLATESLERGMCTRCGHKQTTSRAVKKKAQIEAQVTFGFAKTEVKTDVIE
jgi:hypothetical protein